MDKKITVIVVLLSVIMIVSFIQAFQLMDIKAKLSVAGLATGGSAANGKLDTTGWTENEKMNYEMHGTIPARIGQGSSSGSSASSMVGGC
ncbi:MAG: hypothetical protein Q7J54_04175 [Candidatus Woesearchaeota archaeon]|nr:hypothetical protein [Candidatus Woesearchaeota archaeon]